VSGATCCRRTEVRSPTIYLRADVALASGTSALGTAKQFRLFYVVKIHFLFLASFLLGLELLLKLTDLLLQLLIVLFLKYELFDQELPIGLLLLKLGLQPAVLLAEFTVLSLCPLRDICDQLKVVL